MDPNLRSMALAQPPSAPTVLGETFDTVNRLVDRFSEINAMLGDLRDRLFGSRPVNASASALQSAPNGELERIQEQIGRLHDLRSSIADHAAALSSLA